VKAGTAATTVAFVMALGVACGGTTSSLSPVSAAQACADAATAVCAAVNSCSSLLIQLEYGDMQTCAMRFQGTCASALAASGTGWTPAAEDACSKALPGESCADIVSNNPPSACQTPAGLLANGVACGDGAQCQSKYCNLGTNGTCGACGTRSGGTCDRDADCGYGQTCVKGGCVAPGLSGSTCDDATHPCNKTLACKNGVCAAPDEAGASCTVGNANNPFGSCDVLKGLYCHALTRVCQAVTFASPGQPCGLVNGGLTACSANGACNAGTCAAALADGASCTATDHCSPPATCSGGVCKLPDPSMCK
jgi:hypothetical protein